MMWIYEILDLNSLKMEKSFLMKKIMYEQNNWSAKRRITNSVTNNQ